MQRHQGDLSYVGHPGWNLITASEDTVAKVYDNLDFTHALEAFVNTLQGVSIDALRKGLLGAALKDNEVMNRETSVVLGN